MRGLTLLLGLLIAGAAVPHVEGAWYCNCPMCRKLRQYGYPGGNSAWHYQKYRQILQYERNLRYQGRMKKQGLQEAESMPTPWDAAEIMSELGDVRGKVVVDPGCGPDCRLLIAAARAGAKRCIGYEIDYRAAQKAREAVKKVGLSDVIFIWHMDSTKGRWKADVGLVYLFHDVIQKLEKKWKDELVVFYAHGPEGNDMPIDIGEHRFYMRIPDEEINATPMPVIDEPRMLGDSPTPVGAP